MLKIAEDQSVHCRVSISGFLDALRQVNGIEGRGVTSRYGLHLIGSKAFEQVGAAAVYLAAASMDQPDLANALRLLGEACSEAQVIVFPSWPSIPRSAKTLNQFFSDLSDCFRINWPIDLQCPAHPEPAARARPPARPKYALINEGASWRLIFEGKETTVRDSKGIRYLAKLLANPGKSFTALELAHPELSETQAAQSDLEATDLYSLREYRRRLQQIDEQLEEARAFENEADIRRLEEEKDALIQHLAQVSARGGRSRLTGQKEKARQSVSKAIKRAISKLPIARDHFAASIQTGSRFAFVSQEDEP